MDPHNHGFQYQKWSNVGLFQGTTIFGSIHIVKVYIHITFPLYLHKTMNMPLDYWISIIGCMDDKHADLLAVLMVITCSIFIVP